jgi:SAM-dependent methyltransferase
MTIDLKTERMKGKGPGGYPLFNGFQPNYLFGLDDLCKKFIKRGMRVLEIGCNRGVSTNLFCEYAYKVTAVDKKLNPEMEELLDVRANLSFVESFSHDYLKSMPADLFDLIYLDGHHGYETVMEELELITKKCKPGYILSGHDMYPSSHPDSQVQMAVGTFFPELKSGKRILHRFSDSSWAIEM